MRRFAAVFAVIILVTCLSIAVSQEVQNPPAHGCWIKVWETKDFKDKSEIFVGPRMIADMEEIGWKDEIDAIVVGPKAWVIAYEDINYEDNVRYFGPGTTIRDLDDVDFSDQIDSMKIYNEKPPEWQK